MTKSRKVRWVEDVVCMGGKTNAFTISVQNLKEKRPLGKSKHG
jgi:hypothetical protein